MSTVAGVKRSSLTSTWIPSGGGGGGVGLEVGLGEALADAEALRRRAGGRTRRGARDLRTPDADGRLATGDWARRSTRVPTSAASSGSARPTSSRRAPTPRRSTRSPCRAACSVTEPLPVFTVTTQLVPVRRPRRRDTPPRSGRRASGSGTRPRSRAEPRHLERRAVRTVERESRPVRRPRRPAEQVRRRGRGPREGNLRLRRCRSRSSCRSRRRRSVGGEHDLRAVGRPVGRPAREGRRRQLGGRSTRGRARSRSA